MGADLYTKSIADPARKQYEEEFQRLCCQRDSALTNEEKGEIQKKIGKCWDLMYPESGYFRDSYNSWNLLWQLDLSWWRDVGKMLDERGYLTPEKAKEFREMVAGRELPTPPKAFHGEGWGESTNKVYHHFVSKKAQLLRFLDKAVELGEPILCSL